LDFGFWMDDWIWFFFGFGFLDLSGFSQDDRLIKLTIQKYS